MLNFYLEIILKFKDAIRACAFCLIYSPLYCHLVGQQLPKLPLQESVENLGQCESDSGPRERGAIVHTARALSQKRGRCVAPSVPACGAPEHDSLHSRVRLLESESARVREWRDGTGIWLGSAPSGDHSRHVGQASAANHAAAAQARANPSRALRPRRAQWRHPTPGGRTRSREQPRRGSARAQGQGRTQAHAN